MTMPQPLKLFVSTRSADESAFVDLLRTRFAFRYGRENVFTDLDLLQPHVVDFLRHKIHDCDVVVLIIGPHGLETLNAKSASGAGDYARLELEEALRLDKVIAPVLIEGASVPQLHEIPAELRSIFSQTIPSLTSGRDQQRAIGWFMDGFERILRERGLPRTTANADQRSPIEDARTLSIDALMDRFTEAVQNQDLSLGLIWAAEIRAAGTVPAFFRLDEREAELRKRLKAGDAAQHVHEVVDYLYGFVRRMQQLNDDPDTIRAALKEIWAIEPDYDPDGIAAALADPTPAPPSPAGKRASSRPRKPVKS